MDMKTNAEEMESWLNSPIPKRVINEWKKENKLKIKTEEEKINRIIIFLIFFSFYYHVILFLS